LSNQHNSSVKISSQQDLKSRAIHVVVGAHDVANSMALVCYEHQDRIRATSGFSSFKALLQLQLQ